MWSLRFREIEIKFFVYLFGSWVKRYVFIYLWIIRALSFVFGNDRIYIRRRWLRCLEVEEEA